MAALDWLVRRPIAHRGYHDRAAGRVENTLAAARAAIARDFAIECDLQVTSDGHAVVFHDDRLERLTDGRGPIRALDLAAQPLGVGVALWFHDADAPALHASLVAAGVPIAKEPITGPFGFTFTFTDPDGYAITVHDRLSPT